MSPRCEHWTLGDDGEDRPLLLSNDNKGEHLPRGGWLPMCVLRGTNIQTDLVPPP